MQEHAQIELSRHASVRGKQRGIAPLLIDLLFRFGASIPAGDSTEKLYFDKRSRKKITSYTGGFIKASDENLDVYAIVQGQQVITIGHRTKRLRH